MRHWSMSAILVEPELRKIETRKIEQLVWKFILVILIAEDLEIYIFLTKPQKILTMQCPYKSCLN